GGSILALNRGKPTSLQIVSLAVFCLISFTVVVWRSIRVAQERNLEAGYYSARTGDISGIRRLAADGSAQSKDRLESLARNPSVPGKVRVAAVSALGDMKNLPSGPLAKLLSIDQEGYVRHAAAAVFVRRGCDTTCVSAVLVELNRLARGGHAIEDKWLELSPEVIRKDPQ